MHAHLQAYADTQILTRQQKLDKIEEEVQRQKKRILRSKILRLIDHYLSLDCDKFARCCHEQQDLASLQKEFAQQKKENKTALLLKQNKMHLEFDKENKERLQRKPYEERFKPMHFSSQSAHSFAVQHLQGKAERTPLHLVETRRLNIV